MSTLEQIFLEKLNEAFTELGFFNGQNLGLKFNESKEIRLKRFAEYANKLIKRFNRILKQFSYYLSYVNFEFAEDSEWLYVSFLQKEDLKNNQLVYVLKKFKHYTFNTEIIKCNSEAWVRYAIEPSQFEEFLNSLKGNKIKIPPFVEEIHQLIEFFRTKVLKNSTNRIPLVNFILHSHVLELEFVLENGENISPLGSEYEKYLYQPILSDSDRAMANYLFKLNQLGFFERNINNITSLIMYEGYDEFGIKLSEKTREMQMRWKKDPNVAKRFRKEKITNLIGD